MQNGTTYIVRPAMQPAYSPVMIAFMATGSIQLFVAPASFGSTEQMKVRSSTRATSVGSDAAWKELGFAVSRVKVPAATRSSVSRVHSASDPSVNTTRSGRVSAATC